LGGADLAQLIGAGQTWLIMEFCDKGCLQVRDVLRGVGGGDPGAKGGGKAGGGWQGVKGGELTDWLRHRCSCNDNSTLQHVPPSSNPPPPALHIWFQHTKTWLPPHPPTRLFCLQDVVDRGWLRHRRSYKDGPLNLAAVLAPHVTLTHPTHALTHVTPIQTRY
jgi:hypothetical protein